MRCSWVTRGTIQQRATSGLFMQDAIMSSSGMGRDVVHPAFPPPTTASPTLQGAVEDGFGEAVVA